MDYKDLLKGEKVFLDAVQEADVPLLGKWFADVDFLGLLSMVAAFPKTEADERDWYNNQRKSDNYVFAVRNLETGVLLGTTSLMEIDWRCRLALFGIAIAERSVWGQGYGTDATRVILRYGFLELNLHRIELEVYGYNQRAIRSYEKSGFSHEGVRRQAIYRDGTYHDVHIMGILREEWLAANNV